MPRWHTRSGRARDALDLDVGALPLDIDADIAAPRHREERELVRMREIERQVGTGSDQEWLVMAGVAEREPVGRCVDIRPEHSTQRRARGDEAITITFEMVAIGTLTLIG